MRREIIIGTICVVLGGIILDFFLPVQEKLLIIFGSILDAISWAWSSILMHYSMPGWVYLAAIFVAIIGSIKLVKSLNFSSARIEPEFKSYTEDFIDGMIWRWSWGGSQIHDLNCFCPTCDAQLVCSNSLGCAEFICERCTIDPSQRTYHPIGRIIATIRGGDCYYAREATEREIYRRIRKKQTNKDT
ncbi:MAG: hypothetical protein F4160_00650 [Rhodospirillaceae bacterium]|nr:hypothetical protein [Rhodospirillaceae bacterium]MYH35292.1 hypothetical protein [Rhodospirillaceae bacterium]MYK13817.1 hypothetical protein [Rhodospirillaceae bacterium]